MVVCRVVRFGCGTTVQGCFADMFPYSSPTLFACLSLGNRCRALRNQVLPEKGDCMVTSTKVGTIKAQGSLWRAWRSLHSCHLQLATSRKM
jgi:hypothetical protein